MADKFRQVREDGSAFYFLATADHKTSTNELAYIYAEEEDWELFRIYRQNIRRHPETDQDAEFLFLNTKGRQISNPSGNLATMLKRYGVEVLSCNDARHIIETLGKHHLNKDEQMVIHRMLTHTPQTAERSYMEAHSLAVPHRQGLPLLERLRKQVAAKHKIKVSSLLARSQSLMSGHEEGSNTTASLTARAIDSSTSAPASVSVLQISDKTAAPSSTPVLEENEPAPRSSSPTESIHSSASTDSRDQNDKMKELLEQRRIEVHADQPLPNADSYKRLVRENAELNLPLDENALKRWNSFVTYERMKLRADECVKYYKRTKITDINAAAASFLEKKGWTKGKKQIDACRTKLKDAKKEEDLTKRFKSSEDEALEEQIKEQSWPNVRLKKTGNKGLGAFAAADLKKDTLLCDYHGTLLEDAEGWRRYENYGDTEENAYMYQFDYRTGHESKKLWIDGVAPCQCHSENKKLKGRKLNNSQKKQNVKPRVKTIHDVPHILFYAARDIQFNEELTFNYGVWKDKHSAQHSWMKD